MSQLSVQPDIARERRPVGPLVPRAGPPQEAPHHAVASLLGWVFAPVLAHRRALLWLNLVYFGAMGLGALYTAVDPRVQRSLLDAVGVGFSPGTPLGTLADAYHQGALLSAIGLTF